MKRLLNLGVLSLFMFSLSISGVFASSSFTDVPDGEWYTDAVLNLTEMGIIRGYPDETFRPEKLINRAEVAVIINRYYEMMTQPYGSEWRGYETDDYGVWYPADFVAYFEESSDSCGSNSMYAADGFFEAPNWVITCDDTATDPDDVMMDLASGDEMTSLFEETVEINGSEAKHYILMTLDTDSDSAEVMYHEALFFEGADHQYMLYDYSPNALDPQFKTFYQSFHLFDVFIP